MKGGTTRPRAISTRSDSTAEAVGVASSLGLEAAYFPGDRDLASLVPGYLLGVVLKDDPKDRGRLH